MRNRLFTNVHPMVLVVAASLIGGCAADTAKEGGAEPELGVSELGSADGHALYQGELAYGELYAGEVTARSPYRWWSFEAEAGQTVWFDAASRDGDDLFMILYRRTPSGYAVYEYNDDCYSGTYNACLEPTFAEAGEYAVLVTTYSYAYWGYGVQATFHLQTECRSCEPAPECPSEEEVNYVSRDPEECARIRFACIATMTHFSNECGCGCAPIDAPAEECEVGGCSSQVCHEPGEEVVTTCEWREQYACYRSATCERQPDGSCGWTPTEELNSCLEAASDGSL